MAYCAVHKSTFYDAENCPMCMDGDGDSELDEEDEEMIGEDKLYWQCPNNEQHLLRWKYRGLVRVGQECGICQVDAVLKKPPTPSH